MVKIFIGMCKTSYYEDRWFLLNVQSLIRLLLEETFAFPLNVSVVGIAAL